MAHGLSSSTRVTCSTFRVAHSSADQANSQEQDLPGITKSQSPLPSSLHLPRPVPPVTHQAVFGGLRNWTDTNAVADGQSGKTEETC